MLKCGGGKALTKPASEETALKCHTTLEETNKVGEVNSLAICNAQANHMLEDKLEVPLIRNGIKLKRSSLGKIMPELYNLENSAESEKPVKIELDLDLYQMEEV